VPVHWLQIQEDSEKFNTLGSLICHKGNANFGQSWKPWDGRKNSTKFASGSFVVGVQWTDWSMLRIFSAVLGSAGWRQNWGSTRWRVSERMSSTS
jgi:hypothetical protein